MHLVPCLAQRGARYKVDSFRIYLLLLLHNSNRSFTFTFEKCREQAGAWLHADGVLKERTHGSQATGLFLTLS